MIVVERTMPSVVVIEDEPAILDFLESGLRREGYRVESARDGRRGAELVREERPDLVILDLMLPGLAGLDVLERLRGSGDDVPVLLLTAKDDVLDKIRGLDRGADDYLTKPFRLEELLARARALLRRRRPELRRVLSSGDITLDVDTREVRRGDRSIELTPREFDLLRCFLEHPRRVLDRQVLLERVWDYEVAGDANVVEVYVRYLRRKLGAPDPIRTVRGVGYALGEG